MIEEYFYPNESYDSLVASAGTIIKDWNIGDWQGDYVYLLKNGNKFGFTVVGYGSCSHCDALQSCDSQAELDELKEEISGDNYLTAQSVLYDTEVEGGLKIFYTVEKGVSIMLQIVMSKKSFKFNSCTVYLLGSGDKRGIVSNNLGIRFKRTYLQVPYIQRVQTSDTTQSNIGLSRFKRGLPNINEC